MTQQPPPRLPEEYDVPDSPDVSLLPMEQIIYEAPRRQGRSGCFWGVLGALGCLTILLLPLIVALLIGSVSFGSLLSNVQGLFTAHPPVASVVSTQTILTGIQPMGQLVSVSAQLAKADIFIGVQQGTLNACGFSANHVAQGTVEAGIDLTRITDADLQYDETTNTYTVTLPAAQLTSCRVDFIRQYERSLTACPVDWDEARLLANYEAVSGFRTDALENGILDRAQREAQVALTNFIHLLTGSDVKIVFKTDTSAQLPASCTPDSPAGWVLDAATNAWTKVSG